MIRRKQRNKFVIDFLLTDTIINLNKSAPMKIIVKQGSGSEKIKDALKKIRKKPGRKVNLSSFVGILELKEDPIKFQQRLRDER